MNYATFIRHLPGQWPQEAWLFHLHPPYDSTSFIVILQHGWGLSAFPCDEDGLLLSAQPLFVFENIIDPLKGLKEFGYPA